MSEIAILLLVVSTALSAYARGRREGTWSWPLFIKTVLGLWAIGAGIAVAGIWFSRWMGPDHALLVTVLIVAFIAAGVVILTRWVCNKTGRDNK